MNLLYLKYIIEIDNERSIKKAAQKLFMEQPNLSRIVKNVEYSLGFEIFIRTSKGIETTILGKEFISDAKKLIEEVNNVESKYTSKNKKNNFSIACPRATYISYAFINLLKMVSKEETINYNYKETDVNNVIKLVAHNGFDLGILRYQPKFKDFYMKILNEFELNHKEIAKYKYVLIMSKNHALANKEVITKDDLKKYVELTHGDPYIPLFSYSEMMKEEYSGITNKNVYIYERGSQFDILQNIEEMFMWNSPLPDRILKQYNLIQRYCNDYQKDYEDILIYRVNYHFTNTDNMFLTELNKMILEVTKTK